MSDRLVTTTVAAKATGMDPRTIRKGVDKWIDEGDVPGAIPGRLTPGGKYRVDLNAILQDERSGKVTPIVRPGGFAGKLREIA